MKKVLLFNLCCLLLLYFTSVTVIANYETKIESVEEFIYEIKREKKVVENKNKKALNSITVDNNDGTNTVYVFNQDIKYVDEDGNIVDKDLSLTPSNDKNRIKSGHILTVKSNDIESAYPISFNGGGIVLENIELQPIGSKAVLNRARLDVAEYDNVFAGVNFVCEPEYQGFSAKLEVDTIAALQDVKFDIVGDGIDNIFAKDGKIIIEDEFSTYEITGSKIVNSENEVLGNSTLALNDEEQVVVEYNVSDELLDTESVSTNISVTINENRFYSVTLYEDTVPTNDGYNYIGTKDGYGAARTLIKFDLSALEGIPYDKILSAYYYTGILPGSRCIAEMFMITSPWSATIDNIDFMPNVDYNNKVFRITVNNPGQSGSECVASEKFYITSAIQAWLQGYENNGLLIKSRNDEDWATLISPVSGSGTSEDTDGVPCLIIKYSTDTNVPISKGIERGESYYFINRKTKSSISVLDTIPPSDLILNDFAMTEYEEWNVMYDSTVDGVEYFRLRHGTSSSFLEATEPDTQGNSIISTSTFSNIDGQKWQIKRNWNGSYKIIPKNSNGTKALSVQYLTDDSYTLVLEDITIDSDEKDDWTLVPCYKEDATLYGSCLSCSNLDTQSEIANITSILTSNGYECVNYHSCGNASYDNSEEMAYKYLIKLFDSQIWYFGHHGMESKMVFSEPNSDLQESRIGVYDEVEYCTDDNRYINTYGVSDYEGDLNKLQFAQMNACFVGANDGNENLVGTMYEEGAHCIIANNVSVESSECEEWQILFNLALQVSDIKTSIVFAERANLDSAYLNHWVPKHILGDTSIFVNYEANAVGMVDDIEESSLNNSNDNIQNLNNIQLLSTSLYSTSATSNNELYYEFDSNGNIHGYSKYLQDAHDYKVQLLYSFNDRYNEYGNNYVDNITSAMNLARTFITEEMNFNITSDYSIEYTKNAYSHEFVYRCVDNDAVSGTIKGIVVYIEEDEDNNQKVTFYQAIYSD